MGKMKDQHQAQISGSGRQASAPEVPGHATLAAHLGVIVALICSRVCAQKVKVALVVNVPHMDTLCLV